MSPDGMRILVFYRYYWPDTAPFGRVLAALAQRWQAQGHEVTVVTSQPGYKPLSAERSPRREVHDGVTIHRVRGLAEGKGKALAKLINHVLYALQVIFFALRHRGYDVIIVNSYPPVLGGVTGRIASALSGTPFIYNVNDLHPESAELAGYLRKGVMYRLLRRLDAGSCRAARTLITMSQDMANTIAERDVARDDIIVRNVLLPNDFDEDHPPNGFRKDFDDTFVVLYAGNIGGFQGLETAVQAAQSLSDQPQIQFVFLGDGVEKDNLVKAAGDLAGRSIHFLPFSPASEAFAAMRRADFGLSALRPGVFRVAYPSKTLAYLSAGCPVLALIEQQSALATEVEDQRLGLVCPQGDPKALAQVIAQAYEQRDDWRARRPEIRAYSDRQFQFEGYLQAWTDIVEQTARKGSGT